MRPRLRRRDWLNRRRRRAQKYPLPADVMVVNAMSVSAPAKRAEHIIRRAVAVPDVVLWLGSEGYKANVRALVGPQYEVIQYGAGKSESLAGSFVIADKDRVLIHEDSISLRIGSPSTAEGGGIRARYIIRFRATFDPGTPHAWTEWVDAGHAPPRRAANAARKFMDALKVGRGIKGGDMNAEPRAIERALGRKVRSVGVLGLSVPRWIPTGDAVGVDVGGDHKAVRVTLFPSN